MIDIFDLILKDIVGILFKLVFFIDKYVVFYMYYYI